MLSSHHLLCFSSFRVSCKHKKSFLPFSFLSLQSSALLHLFVLSRLLHFMWWNEDEIQLLSWTKRNWKTRDIEKQKSETGNIKYWKSRRELKSSLKAFIGIMKLNSALQSCLPLHPRLNSQKTIRFFPFILTSPARWFTLQLIISASFNNCQSQNSSHFISTSQSVKLCKREEEKENTGINRRAVKIDKPTKDVTHQKESSRQLEVSKELGAALVDANATWVCWCCNHR